MCNTFWHTAFFPLIIDRLLSPLQPAISCPLGWLPSSDHPIAPQLMLCNPSATLWVFRISRPAGNIRCQTTRTPSMSASIQISLHSAVPSLTLCSSSSGKQLLLFMMTALVRLNHWTICRYIHVYKEREDGCHYSYFLI